MADWKIQTRGFKEFEKTFRDAPRRIADLGRQWAKDVAADEVKYIRKEAPKRTGRLRLTIEPYSRAWLIGVTFKPYPKLGLKLVGWIVEGTRPHVITARWAKALHFVWRGKERFFVSVHHPGTKANDFITRGANKFQGRIRYWLDVLGKRIVKILGD